MVSQSSAQPEPTSSRVAERALYYATVYVLPSAILIAFWDAAARVYGHPQLFPPPLSTFRTFVAAVRDGSLWANSVASMVRIMAGFSIGSVFGVLIGLLMGMLPEVRYVLTPYIDFLRFVSALAWITAFMVWFGVGETSKVLLLIYATTFGIAVNVAEGVSAIPTVKLRAAECFGINRRQMFVWVVLPACVPFIVAGMRLALQNSFTAIIAAEMLAANRGLGFLIMSSRIFLQTDRTYVAIVALGVLGFLTDFLLMRAARGFAGRYQLGD